MRVHLATCAGHYGLAPDDRLLLAALRERGVEAAPAVWEDPFVDWADAAVTVVRSTWDYTFRRDAFVDWADGVASQSRLFNPAEVIAWNTHKGYLLDVARADVPIVPTTLVREGSAFDLEGHVADRGWAEVVVKPAIGAGGNAAGRFSALDLDPAAVHLDRLLTFGDALVQPLLPRVETDGEVSLLVFGDEVSHAVHKQGAPGDFRVHDDHGGTVEPFPVDDELRALAARALAAAPGRTMYARVDVVRGLDDAWCLMELELVEPELFFRFSPEGTARLADAILAAGSDG